MLIPPDPSSSSIVLPAAKSSQDVLLGSPPSSALGDGKRSIRRKDFQSKYGQKHHSYDKEKAPYPLSYDRHVLELEPLDNRLTQYLRGSISFVDFDEHEPPTRVLDLGCGTGTWAIDAAKSWPNCEVVGFDLVDIQIPLRILGSALADRIEWKHGNFLTTKLPFEDDEFDHVHIQSIATGVPESKWGNLFEEVCRILRPGGSVEVIEDDIIFPVLPRWFTNALRSRPLRANSISYPEGSTLHRPSTSSSSNGFVPPSVPPSHDHALLDSLFKSVFENRFINTTPSSVLPSYITTYFRHVSTGPILSFPMPRLPPVQDLPPQIHTSFMLPEQLLNSDTTNVGTTLQNSVVNRPISLSFSSSLSTTISLPSLSNSLRARTTSAPLLYSGDNSISSVTHASEDQTVAEEPVRQVLNVENMPLKRYILDNTLIESERNSTPPGFLVPMGRLESLSERSLAMHLHRSFQIVLASQEAMWEELKDRIRNRKHELLPFGWDDDEELEELQSRKKFEKLVERYQSDMHIRVSLWCSLNDLNWPLPAKEPLSKAELIEEERLRESMIEARKQATIEEMETPSRAVRVIVGFKL